MKIGTYDLAGKVAIVTGAGQGIGKAIAVAYAQLGCQVVCAGRTPRDLVKTCEEINHAAGNKSTTWFKADVSREDDRIRLVQFALEKYGRITHLVNTVGGGQPGTLQNINSDAFNALFDLNVTSATHLIQLCYDSMVASGGGNVINISSVAGSLVQKHFACYGTVKAALDHLTRNLAQDLAPHIRVNGIAPGPIETRALLDATPDQLRQMMAEKTPLKRIGQAEDIANAACFFATDASSWITGQILNVDGGAAHPIFG